MQKIIKLALLTSALSLTYFSPAFAVENKPIKDEPMLRVGDGYTSYDRMSQGETALDLSKTSITYGDLQNSIYFDQSITTDQIARDLNIDISASGGWGSFSASASANYAHHIASNKYSENFTYEEQFYADALLDISKLPSGTGGLSSVAAATYNNGTGLTAFTNRYGDQFIQQLPLGALLFINIQLNFDSLHDKESFNAALGGGAMGLFNASAILQNAVSQSHSKGSVEISAYQLGGDPTRLANIFTKSPSGDYYFLSCSFSSLVNCQKGIAGVLAYSQNDFSTQIRAAITPGGVPQGSLSVAGEPTLAYYNTKFGLLPAPPLPASVNAARLTLATLLTQNQDDLTFVTHLLNMPFSVHYTPELATALRNMQQDLIWNASLFDSQSAINCYVSGLETNCSAILDDIQNAMKPIDQNLLDMMDSAYVATTPVIGIPETLYPSGINQFFGLPIVPVATLSFSSDLSTANLEWIVNSGRGDYSQVRVAGKLPKISSKNIYTGNLDVSILYPDGWHYSQSAPVTLVKIENLL